MNKLILRILAYISFSTFSVTAEELPDQNQVVEIKANEDSYVGKWKITFRGKDRIYKFKVDGTFSGQHLVSGDDFIGRIKRENGKTVMYNNEGRRIATIVTNRGRLTITATARGKKLVGHGFKDHGFKYEK